MPLLSLLPGHYPSLPSPLSLTNLNLLLSSGGAFMLSIYTHLPLGCPLTLCSFSPAGWKLTSAETLPPLCSQDRGQLVEWIINRKGVVVLRSLREEATPAWMRKRSPQGDQWGNERPFGWRQSWEEDRRVGSMSSDVPCRESHPSLKSKGPEETSPLCQGPSQLWEAPWARHVVLLPPFEWGSLTP